MVVGVVVLGQRSGCVGEGLLSVVNTRLLLSLMFIVVYLSCMSAFNTRSSLVIVLWCESEFW